VWRWERDGATPADRRRGAAHRDVAVSTIATAVANAVRYVAIFSLSLSASLSLALRRAILNVTYADNAPWRKVSPHKTGGSGWLVRALACSLDSLARSLARSSGKSGARGLSATLNN